MSPSIEAQSSSALRKALAVFMIGVLALTVALAVAPNAYADDVDTGFGFDLKSKGETSGTAFRHKGHRTPAFMDAQEKTGDDCRMYIDGAREEDGRGERGCTIGVALLKHHGKYEIHNSVREDGLDYARLTSWAPYGWSFVSGVWSPDCRGTYESLNK